MTTTTDRPTNLSGVRVLITGGTTGIGRAIALTLAGCGCQVFICGTDDDHLADALAAGENAGAAIQGMIADQGTCQGVSDFFEVGEKRIGAPEIVILNAGIAETGNVVDLSDEVWREIVDVNLTGYVLGARKAAESMRKRGGQIVMIGSLSAETRKPESAVYTATKAGIRAFAASLRKEVNESGIRVALIEPGSVGSDMIEETPEKQREKVEACEMLLAEDIARAVHFIITEPSRSDIIQMQIRPKLQEI
jgi:3-hydroxy acid dehydrogenase/malonic semialdehyde reductase